MMRRIKVGIVVGLCVGAAFAIWASSAVLVLGNTSLGKMGTTLPKLIAGYLVGGIASGALVGLLSPMSNSVVGAGLMGTVAIAPLALAMRVVLRGLAPWQGVDTFLIVVFSVLDGGAGFAGGQWMFQRKIARDAR